MKILMVCEAVFPENKGGIERWFQQLGQDFHAAGHSVTHYNAANVNEERNGIRYVCSENNSWSYLQGGVRSKSQAIKFGFNLWRWLRTQDFDLIYCSSVPIFSVFASAAAKSDRASLFTEWFEIWSLRYWIRYSGVIQGPIGWFIQLAALQFGDCRFVYTPTAKSAISILNFINKERNIVLPGLCPTDGNFKETEFVYRSNIYFLGRFVDEKQPILAIDAVERFAQNGWTGRFSLIGTGPLAPILKEIICKRNLDTYVEVVENPTDKQILEISSKAFVLIHPSRREGYGLASVEAAYRGIPSILIDYPDNATVDLEISPKLVSKGDSIDEISELLKVALLNQRELREETINWAKEATIERSSTKTCKEILEIAKSISETYEK